MRSPVFRIQTLGCRLNQAESAALAGGLAREGIELSDHEEDPCDVFVVHTCAITHAAEVESLRAVRHARRMLGPGVLLAVTGCAVALPGAEAAFREAGADLVVPQVDKARIPALVAAALRQSSADDTSTSGPATPLFTTTRALLRIQDGCGMRCSYCIVPATRGAPRSRPFAEAVAEANALYTAGFRELVLTGVNIACYRDGGRSLADIAAAVLALPSRRDGRLRIGSTEPLPAVRALLGLAESEPALCRFFHFPLQSGSDRILRAMRRPYTSADYESLLEAVLTRMPDACLGADVITGFPGEDEAAFAETRSLLERWPFGNLHVFPYSERPGTDAASMEGSVPVAVRRERARELVALAAEKRAAFARRFVGRTVEVLVERVAPDGTGTGWSGEYLECRIPGCSPADVNTIRPFLVTSAKNGCLFHGGKDKADGFQT